MTEPTPSTQSGEPLSTPDALMDAALGLLADRGVLAGLNLREVAERVGVAATNVYHYFGSRQGLLRSAIRRRVDAATADVVASHLEPFAVGRERMFDLVLDHPEFALSALLALDDDPDFDPLPFWEETARAYADRQRSGELPDDVDIEMLHILSLAAAIGWTTFRRSIARRLDKAEADLDDRARTALRHMLLGALERPVATRTETAYDEAAARRS